jgi:hypothetical protein
MLVRGLIGLALMVAAEFVGSLRLPRDAVYNSVIYLMWSSTRVAALPVGLIQLAIKVLAVFACAVAVWAGLRPRRVRATMLCRLACGSLVLSAWYLATTLLPRFTANLLYSFATHVTRDFTPTIARLEGPLLMAIQRLVDSRLMRVVGAWEYSVVWFTLMLLSVPMLVLAGRARLSRQAVIGVAVASLAAIPLFLLVPVFDPWSVNVLYQGSGAASYGVRYLFPLEDVGALTDIIVNRRWAAGAALPSLHVAFPLTVAWMANRDGATSFCRIYGALGAITAASVVMLGRHWLVDVVLAVGYAIAIGRIAIWCEKHLPRGWSNWQLH